MTVGGRADQSDLRHLLAATRHRSSGSVVRGSAEPRRPRFRGTARPPRGDRDSPPGDTRQPGCVSDRDRMADLRHDPSPSRRGTWEHILIVEGVVATPGSRPTAWHGAALQHRITLGLRLKHSRTSPIAHRREGRSGLVPAASRPADAGGWLRLRLWRPSTTSCNCRRNQDRHKARCLRPPTP